MCGKQRTLSPMKMEVWQGKELRACFVEVWQMKDLGKCRKAALSFEDEMERGDIFLFAQKRGCHPGCFSDVSGNAGVISARVTKSEEKRGDCIENRGVKGSLFVGCFGERVRRVERSAGFKGRTRRAAGDLTG